MLTFLYNFFDKIEDRIRGKLSRWPIVYAFIGGIGIVLFWRGVWHLTDMVMLRYFGFSEVDGMSDIYQLPWGDGFLSLAVGSLLLLLSGNFVSNFIGNEIIISGLRGEKKIVDKTKKEIIMEMDKLAKIQHDLKKISSQLTALQKKK